MADKETRVGIYADLREKIDKMDTLSFDDPDRDKKYGLNKTATSDSIPVVHEESMSKEELEEGHIKKNTLSISIEDLIKQNDDYTMAIEKKELDKKYKDVKKKQRKETSQKTWIVVGISAGILLVVIAIILIGLHIGGVI
jgi:CHASE3 domain sensor protein